MEIRIQQNPAFFGLGILLILLFMVLALRLGRLASKLVNPNRISVGAISLVLFGLCFIAGIYLDEAYIRLCNDPDVRETFDLSTLSNALHMLTFSVWGFAVLFIGAYIDQWDRKD